MASDGEGQVPRSLAPGGVDEPQVRSVREQADRDLGLAQEPLKASLGAGLPAVVLGIGLGGVVEVEAELDPLDQHEPWRRVASCWLLVAGELGDGVGRAEGLVVLRQGHFERLGDRIAVGAAEQVGRLPSQDLCGEAREVADGRLRVVLTLHGDLFDELVEAGMVRDDVFIRVRSSGSQRRRRDNQADRLEVAEPFLMRDEFRVSGHGESC